MDLKRTLLLLRVGALTLAVLLVCVACSGARLPVERHGLDARGLGSAALPAPPTPDTRRPPLRTAQAARTGPAPSAGARPLPEPVVRRVQRSAPRLRGVPRALPAPPRRSTVRHVPVASPAVLPVLKPACGAGG